MNLQNILSTVLLIGSDLPAYKALFDEVVAMLSENDQATLRDAYDTAMVDAARAHQEAQA